jgi:hypothetical protein
MKHSHSQRYTTPKEVAGTHTVLDNHVSLPSTNGCGGSTVVLSKVAKECKACQASSRLATGTKRKALEDLSENSINQRGAVRLRRERPKRTRYGCSICMIPLCQFGTCWQEHKLKTFSY